MSDALTLTTDPAYPWSLPAYGTLALLGAVLLLGGLTVWTYLGVTRASFRRLFIMLCLRFLALFLAILALLRPALASRDDLKTPSALIILLDASESMTIKDEFGGLSRWDALRRILDKCAPALQQLRDDQNVVVYLKTFAEDVADYDPQRLADGKRTDTGTALNVLLQEHSQQRFLRGLLLLSDGADNGTRFDAEAEARKWRRSCPVTTFVLGQATTSTHQHDIGIANIIPSPNPIPVKNRLTITAVINAPGFENAVVPVRLLIDDKEVKEALVQHTLAQTLGNEVKLYVNAPDRPGEIKVTVKVDPQVGEMILANNEMSTYVSVTKDGLSVLYVEGRRRAFEPKFIKDALADPRIRLDEMLRDGDEPLSLDQAKRLKFEDQHYDVIILGDITARRLSGGDPNVLKRIRDEVVDKGTGLMMIGGYENYGNSDWLTLGQPLADILPVDLKATGQIEIPVQVVPTAAGLERFIMRLADHPKENEETWKKLRLQQLTRMGAVKAGATVLARANDALTGTPILVSQEVGAGRVLTFAGDTTWSDWRNLGLPKTREGIVLHGRFWKQIALWLAKQEEAAGNVWVKPDARLLSAGDKLGFTVGLRGKGGIDLADAEFAVKILTPQKLEPTVPTSREGTGHRGLFTKTDHAGEYKIVVVGKGKDTDGKEINGQASARFLVKQDTDELLKQAANPELLARLASAGGGKALRAEELPRFLQELRHQPLPQLGQKVELWPDWRSNKLSGFMVLFFLLFVGLVSTEWFLRRRWGLV